MHGVREELLQMQLAAVGLPAIVMHIPFLCPNETYEQKMAAVMDEAKASDVTHIIFGDLFLEDVRAYRERLFSGTGIVPVFPVWGRDIGTRARNDQGRRGSAPFRRRSEETASFIRWSALRQRAARLVARGYRSLRGEWRVPFLCFSRPNASTQYSGDRRRDCRA